MDDREAVARAIASGVIEELLRSGDPEIAEVYEANNPAKAALGAARAVDEMWPKFVSNADATIACLRERWTSEAAVKRACIALYGEDGLLESEAVMPALTAAMRDE